MTLQELAGAKSAPETARDTDFSLSQTTQRVLIACLAGLVALRFLAMYLVPVIDTTESRYAEIARKMIETSNWITPQYDYGIPFWGKPPLHSWLSASGMELFGVNEFAARLPIMLTAILCALLVYQWVKHIRGPNTALIVLTVLASTSMFFIASAIVMTDMPMTLGCVMAMVGYWNATHLPKDQKSDFRWGMTMFVGLAIGLLAKGPVALVLCVMPIGLFTLITWRWSVLKHLPWLRGITLLLVLVLPWYIAAEQATPGFLRYFFIGEHYERFVVPGWEGDLYGSGHSRPKGLIWVYALITLFPWTFALIFLGTRPRKFFSSISDEPQRWRLYLLLWVIAPLILFTPAANILPSYVLPGLPAAAVLGVVLFGDLFGKNGGRYRNFGFGAALITSFALFAFVTIAAGFYPEKFDLRSQKALVLAAQKNAPVAPLYFLNSRSYSAEFYTNGVAKTVHTGGELDALLAGQEVVHIAVAKKLVNAFDVQERLTKIEDFGAYVLFAHPKNGGLPNE